MNWTKIMECVPNFSEGRDLQKIDEIVSPFRAKAGVKLLDYSNDEDHNRLVVTVVGEPDALKEAVIEAIGIAVELIDLNHHQGQHPRMGAVDVVPFIPIKGCTMEDAIAVSKEVGQRVASQYNLPVFLYEKSASAPHRENLAVIRKGEFEGMKEKIHQPEWHPDFGPAERHPTAGTVAIGARMPLVAYNINLNTPSLEIAHDIAKKIRFIGGGLRYCKAMGVELKDRGITQVSMNLTDYSKTAIYRAFEMVRFEAKRYGVSIIGSEIVGLVPMEALIDTASYYLGLETSPCNKCWKHVSWNKQEQSYEQQLDYHQCPHRYSARQNRPERRSHERTSQHSLRNGKNNRRYYYLCGENRISHEKPGYKVLDARGNVLLPGFVDSHTHLVFGGFRPDEFIWRLNGDSYMSIMERGGGIINTVRATREASFEELKHKAEWFLDTMSRMGVTTVEGKSGYGLDRDTELKQLSVMQVINECPDRKVDIATTFLGAHALPEEYKGRSDAYIDFLINEMLPMIHQKQLAENCDIFCEKGVFTVDQSRKLLKAAQALGFGAKLHADEIVSFGGAELAGELKALSADHLLQASDEGIKALAQNNVVATLLPLTAFTLKEPYARGRKMIDSGCAVALATDLNPGSCFSGSIPLTFALACIYMKLTVAEAITAITLNGAAALGRADRIGSIEAGKQGDFVLLGTDTPHILPYYTGMNAVKLTIKGGRILNSN